MELLEKEIKVTMVNVKIMKKKMENLTRKFEFIKKKANRNIRTETYNIWN